MTLEEAEAYYEKLTAAEATRFKALVMAALTLGKPSEGAYEYAHTMMEDGNDE